jgi:hypothetical protein
VSSSNFGCTSISFLGKTLIVEGGTLLLVIVDLGGIKIYYYLGGYINYLEIVKGLC